MPISIYPFTRICKKCNAEFIISERKFKSRTHCSRKCANSRIQTAEIDRARSQTLLAKPKAERVPKKKYCKQCSCQFETFGSDRYCSHKCRNMNLGGYRENSGRSKSGYYKGIYSGSTYELVWMIYNLDHGLKFERFGKLLTGFGIKYIPDFIQNDKLVEIKGYGKPELIDLKCKVAISNGYEIDVLYKTDIQHMFDYVTSKYGTNKYAKLYDDYKPKYEYVCDYCKMNFQTDVKRGRSSKHKYCSQRHAMLGARNIYISRKENDV